MTPTLGMKLRVLRVREGVTMEEVGAELGVTKQWVSLVEKGKGIPTVKGLMVWASFIGATGDEMIDLMQSAGYECQEDHEMYRLRHIERRIAAASVALQDAIAQLPAKSDSIGWHLYQAAIEAGEAGRLVGERVTRREAYIEEMADRAIESVTGQVWLQMLDDAEVLDGKV